MSVDAPPITRLGRDRNGKLVVVVGKRMGRKDRRRIHGRYSKYQENPK